MSNILSYNNKTTKTAAADWIAVEPYSDDDIRAIRDPNGGRSERPRTAVPSPLAQLDLVKNAFATLAASGLRGGTLMDGRLVSDALDVAQLFFGYESHRDRLHIVHWSRRQHLQALLDNPAHRLYGQTLQLFMRTDAAAYNFDLCDDWYMLMLDNTVLGATSPATLTMAAPGLGTVESIKVEQGVPLFSTVRHLHERDGDFVLCLYLLMNAWPVLRQRLGDLYAYMLVCLERIRQQRPDLYGRITAVVPNPSAYAPERAAAVLQSLDMDFTAFSGDCPVTALGVSLYRKPAAEIARNAAASDFVIAATRPGDGPLPLVLRSGVMPGYRYVDRAWNSATQVLAPAGVPLHQRTLPDTSLQYPFVTTSDLLCPQIVQLAGETDEAHFFAGNITARGSSRHGYLLPLQPLFFKYFTTADLAGTVLGRPMLQMEEGADGSVTVTLRVPVRKRYVELTRTYLPVDIAQWGFDERRGTGAIVRGNVFSASVFPFVRTGEADNYTVQLFTQSAAGQVSLRFLGEGLSAAGIAVRCDSRTATAFYHTAYYGVEGSFSIIEVTVSDAAGRPVTGMALPRWQPYAPSDKQLVFAVDFGTTNSHVEWAVSGQDSQPLTFTAAEGDTLIASLLRPGSLDSAETLQRVEFLPRDIDSLYGFPLRTALASTAGNAGHGLFSRVNIPLLYERKYFQGYDIATGLKWSGDTTLSQEFLREIMMLIRAKAILERACLPRTGVVYFYPVAMGGADRRRLAEQWTTLYQTYIGPDTGGLRAYPESIAPAFYYTGAQVAGGSYASIDIGGGTSDVVVYQPAPGGLRTEPAVVSSFRFAGDAIFGDGFGPAAASANPLLQHYCQYFSRLIDRNDELAYLNSILADIRASGRSEDVNAFLFSVENVEELRQRREIDRRLFSYNALLRGDETRRPVFLYFYSAIIYYIASLIKARSLTVPKQLYFSGTGSKILGIIGTVEQVARLTRTIFERVTGQTYTESFEIKIERDQPKQITCRGGVRLENLRLSGREDSAMYSPRAVNAIKYCHPMVGDHPLTLAEVSSQPVRDALVERVRQYNAFFLSLLDADTCDDLGIERPVLEAFAAVVDNDIPNYLTAGIAARLSGRYNDDDVVEDVPFFYPITGIIRHGLLPALTHERLSARP